MNRFARIAPIRAANRRAILDGLFRSGEGVQNLVPNPPLQSLFYMITKPERVQDSRTLFRTTFHECSRTPLPWVWLAGASSNQCKTQPSQYVEPTISRKGGMQSCFDGGCAAPNLRRRLCETLPGHWCNPYEQRHFLCEQGQNRSAPLLSETP